MSHDISFPLAIDDIDIPVGRREVDVVVVKRIADSIDQIGLRHPITVKRKGERYVLIVGRHRLEAFKKLDRDFIPATIVTMTNDEARLWEIAENLHRAELTKLERDEQVAEWIRITEKLHAVQSAPHGKAGQKPGGISAAARELGIEETDAKRSVKVASLSAEAKEAARESGLDNNRSALLKAAKEPTPEAQVAKVAEIAAAKAETKTRSEDRSGVPELPSFLDRRPKVDDSVAQEMQNLARGLSIALPSIDPTLDRIIRIGIDVFWRQADERLRKQVVGTAQLLQVITAACAAHQHAALTSLSTQTEQAASA